MHVLLPNGLQHSTLAESADMVFCPYNYLLDPMVRATLQVDLTDAVIIFDEAHNLEDSCRYADAAAALPIMRVSPLAQVSRFPMQALHRHGIQVSRAMVVA